MKPVQIFGTIPADLRKEVDSIRHDANLSLDEVLSEALTGWIHFNRPRAKTTSSAIRQAERARTVARLEAETNLSNLKEQFMQAYWKRSKELSLAQAQKQRMKVNQTYTPLFRKDPVAATDPDIDPEGLKEQAESVAELLVTIIKDMKSETDLMVTPQTPKTYDSNDSLNI